MRILHVTPHYEDAWAYGGIPRVASALCRGLVRRGHEVTVATTDAWEPDRRMPRRMRQSVAMDRGGVRVRPFPNLSNGLAHHQQLYLPLGLGRFLRREAQAFDVAHLHALHNVPVSQAARALSRVGVPYVAAPNGTAPLIERRRAGKWLFDKTVGRGVLQGANRVLAVSQAEQDQLLGLGVPAEKIRRLPNPVQADEVTDVEGGRFRRRYGLEGEQVVLYLGQLSPRKGLDTLARAMGRLGAEGPRLVLAGADRGAGGRAARLLAEEGLTARAQAVGVLHGRARMEALADADLVVYVGEHEVFGLVVLESILCGTPVVVADDCGAAELVGLTGGGVAVPVGDATALALQVRQMLDEAGVWKRRVVGAARITRELFDASVVCGELEGIYGEVLVRAS